MSTPSTSSAPEVPEDSSELGYQEINPISANFLTLQAENALADDLRKLLDVVPNLFDIVPHTDAYFQFNTENYVYQDVPFFISPAFANAFFANKTSLMENAVLFQFRKLFPTSDYHHLLRIVAYGLWNRGRLQFWLYQLKQWRDRDMLRMNMRAVIFGLDGSDGIEDKEDMLDRLHELKSGTMKDELEEFVNEKTQKMLKAFLETSPVEIVKEEENHYDYGYEELGFGDTQKMLKAATEWRNILQEEILQLQRDVCELKNPESNDELEEQTRTSSLYSAIEIENRQQSHNIGVQANNLERDIARTSGARNRELEVYYHNLKGIEERYQSVERPLEEKIRQLKRKLEEFDRK